MDGLCQTPMGAVSPMLLLAGAVGFLCPSLLAACIPCIPSLFPQRASLRQRAGLWYPAVLQRLHHGQDVPGLAGGGGQEGAVLRMDPLPWACDFGVGLKAELLGL